NQNQADPKPIVDEYERHFRAQNVLPSDITILEIGAGATNSTGYEMAARGWGEIYLLEPYVNFAEAQDRELLEKLCLERNLDEQWLKARVARLKSMQEVENESMDVILSSSVLEHVSDPHEFFAGLEKALKKDGAMLHVADFRDHFFKYPYHFLQFSKKTWNRWLNPGNLPAWRLSDHLSIMKDLDLTVQILHHRVDREAFEKIKRYVSKDYDLDDPLLAVTTAVLWVKKKSL
ncbi:MAG: class I SAM-dependent methyltransferase, partial [Desulfobacteraceae bacterium]|nr:class I SAM-dependent methyltransferase [Desulfobacteraceae bacterium]